MPDEDPGGKADAFTTIRGSDIPSQFVDGTKKYLLARRIDNLAAVGAFDMVQDPLVRRIDGIIANLPADGKLHLAELVRMEQPQIHDSLFPAEKAALPTLWKMVEAPSTNNAIVGPDAAFGIVDASLPPGPAIMPASFVIASLATELQSPATRLQNLHNADGNTATVQYADLEKGLANQLPFTPTEVAAFRTLQAQFRDQAVATAVAEIVVSPAPGAYVSNETVGPIAIRVDGITKYEEDRQSSSNGTFFSRLTATQQQAATISLPMNAKLLVINKAQAAEGVFTSGIVPVDSTSFVYEVWANGQRTFSTNIQTPALTRTLTTDMTSSLDYTLTSGLAPLVRNIQSAVFTSSASTFKATFDTTTIPPTATPNATALQRVATPTVKLPVGRYTIAAPLNVTLFVHPNNVLWIQRGGQMFRMLPMSNGNSSIPTRFENNQINAQFETSNSALTINNTVVLTASSRDI